MTHNRVGNRELRASSLAYQKKGLYNCLNNCTNLFLFQAAILIFVWRSIIAINNTLGLVSRFIFYYEY